MNKLPKINFIGNKEKIVKWICDNIPKDVNSVFDAFSGGMSVSFEAKKRSFKVITNDVMKINYFLSKALIENNKEILTKEDIKTIFTGKPQKGFMYKNYSEVLFFSEECMELDLYRKNIEKLDSEYKRALSYSLIRRAMIRKMPYSRFNLPWEKIKQLRDEEYSYEKYKRKRAYHNKTFKEHFMDNLDEYNGAVFDNKTQNIAFNEDVFKIVHKIKTDLIYLDPPYTGTMNNYFGFYGMLDEYILNKKLNAFENNFINKNNAINLFDNLFSKLTHFKYWMLSYNNSSYPTKEQLITLLKKYSDNIKVIERNHNYQLTGKNKKNENKEYLFIIENKGKN
jgi:adenine-specific DNA-methyltransferase